MVWNFFFLGEPLFPLSIYNYYCVHIFTKTSEKCRTRDSSPGVKINDLAYIRSFRPLDDDRIFIFLLLF